ncbi:MAG: L-histidine N(alpha)-methyltransferase [Planctomycetota bacterium]
MRAASTETPTPAFFQMDAPDPAASDVALLAGIASPRSSIPPWYFYDTVGSRLFDAITALPNYYPTRTESAILSARIHEMTATRDVRGCAWIDLGAGSCEKAPPLFDHVCPAQYVPVDISADYLRGVVEGLQAEHPDVEMIGVGADFSRQLALPEAVQDHRRLFFYPGSSIGNYEPDAARDLLRQVREQMDDQATLWIGVDLVKDTATLERAYDDELGVTAAFNRNILRNVNAAVGTDFAPGGWQHVAFFNEADSRIEMHLESARDVVVTWPGGERAFSAGERIHTESSYKYTLESFRALLADAGLQTADVWTDERRWFAVFVAAPRR